MWFLEENKMKKIKIWEQILYKITEYVFKCVTPKT